MALSRSRLALLGSLVLLAPLASTACGDDEPAATPGTGGTAGGAGADGGAGAGTGGGAGAAGSDAGPDDGPFGRRVPVSRESDEVSGLTGTVNVVRDRHGMTHIYARSVADAFRMQGYTMAKDRAVQMEIMRRAATGRLSALLGVADPSTIDQDITLRTVGLHRVAQQMYDSLPPGSEARTIVDAYSDGVTQYLRALRDGRVTLPSDKFLGMTPDVFTDWSPVDSLALARLQTLSLSYDGTDDVNTSDRIQRIRDAFPAGSTDPLVQKRAGILRDVVRWQPAALAFHQEGFPDDAPLPGWQGPPGGASEEALPPPVYRDVTLSRPLFQAFQPFAEAIERARNLIGGDEFAGSNNWAVSAAKSQSGHAMSASDPHLGLTSPMVFWPVHLVVENPTAPAEDLEISGLAFAGIPGVILGTNRHLSWTATTAAYDVTDAWKETVLPDRSGVRFRGQNVPFQRIRETISIRGQADYSWDVLVVPHHGPIAPTLRDHRVQEVDPAVGAISIRWTGHQPTAELECVVALWRARTVDEARAAMSRWGTGAQNWTFADSRGDVFTYSPALLPFRDRRAFTWNPNTYQGVTPNMLLDGESGEHEWTGEWLPERYYPKVRSPASGWVATANGDHVGTTRDNDPTNDTLPDGRPFYLQGEYDIGFRIARIQERLGALTAGSGKVSVADMQTLQADHRSPLGARLTPRLVEALRRAEAERLTPGTHPDLAAVVADPRYRPEAIQAAIDALTRWGTEADYAAAAGVNLDDGTLNVPAGEALAARATSLFNAWIVRVLARVFQDETSRWGASNLGWQNPQRALIRLMLSPPSELATYDPSTGESALWDDMNTPEVESPDERITIAMLDALATLERLFGSADWTTWAWGKLHRVTFKPLVPLWLVELPQRSHPIFPNGFPRHGDNHVIDASNYGQNRTLAQDPDFTYGSGPVQRFVAEMTPSGPIVHNALPGGAQPWPGSPFFENESELWRRNQTHVVPFDKDDVAAAAASTFPGTEHVVYR